MPDRTFTDVVRAVLKEFGDTEVAYGEYDPLCDCAICKRIRIVCNEEGIECPTNQ